MKDAKIDLDGSFEEVKEDIEKVFSHLPQEEDENLKNLELMPTCFACA